MLLALLALSGCASLGALARVLQAPVFRAGDQQSEIRLLGPSAGRPLGGASVRIWTRVSNPNPVGLTLSAIRGSLALEGIEAAGVDFPLGLPLQARGESVVPLDVSLSFSDLPRLAQLLPRALGQGSVGYRLNGTVTVDAGILGQPSFGPSTLLEGSLRATR